MRCKFCMTIKLLMYCFLVHFTADNNFVFNFKSSIFTKLTMGIIWFLVQELLKLFSNFSNFFDVFSIYFWCVSRYIPERIESPFHKKNESFYCIVRKIFSFKVKTNQKGATVLKSEVEVIVSAGYVLIKLSKLTNGEKVWNGWKIWRGSIKYTLKVNFYYENQTSSTLFSDGYPCKCMVFFKIKNINFYDKKIVIEKRNLFLIKWYNFQYSLYPYSIQNPQKTFPSNIVLDSFNPKLSSDCSSKWWTLDLQILILRGN